MFEACLLIGSNSLALYPLCASAPHYVVKRYGITHEFLLWIGLDLVRVYSQGNNEIGQNW